MKSQTKDQVIHFRIDRETKKQLERRARQKGFADLSAYLRGLALQDLNETEDRPAATEDLGDRRPDDVLEVLLEMHRKLDRYFGLTYKSTKVRSNYENLRNAIIAVGIMDDAEKRKEYLKGLFKGEAEI